MVTTQLDIPASWDEVTAVWMSRALASSCPGVEVSAVALVLRDDGTNRRARFRVEYGSGAGPATVFLKAADPAHTQMNARTGGVLNEPLLFRSGVELPLDHPAVHAALIDEERLDFLLVMEDVVARAGDPRDATRPLTDAQATNGALALGRLHGAFWGDRLDAIHGLSWMQPFTSWRGMGRGVDLGLRELGDAIPDTIHALGGEQIEDLWQRFMATLGSGAQTLLHGDAHIGNTYVLPDDDIGFLDWQVVRRGNPVIDLGYFLQGAVTTEVRRTSERGIVEAYARALAVPSSDRPSGDDVWLRYRASVVHGLTVWLATAASNWQRRGVSQALAQRYAQAFIDLDTAPAIDELGA